MILFLIFSFIETAIPNDIFQMFKKTNVVKNMKACTEINIAFIPYEEQVNFFFILSSLFICFSFFGANIVKKYAFVNLYKGLTKSVYLLIDP